ncbi:hypothetical protein GQ44DRAFT_778476 [Phaeosphaeriaceae sp. PMI808]|nr:hypothetical protein GQ44DRAFT_778476 [Phaeosphaeriaceae sp. PMI808]
MSNAPWPREDLALQWPGNTKEFSDIETSLSNPYLRLGAPWGFVVVRAVYGPSSDALWAQMLERLRSSVAESLALYDHNDLLPRYDLTVFEDETTIAGADSYAVRRAFRAWVAEDLPSRLSDKLLERLSRTIKVCAKLLSNEVHHESHPSGFVPPRWQFCVFVDEDCLRSFAPSRTCRDLVLKILTTNWELENAGAPTEDFTRD